MSFVRELEYFGRREKVEEKLDKCPFCGKAPLVRGTENGIIAGCECGAKIEVEASLFYAAANVLIKKWNERT